MPRRSSSTIASSSRVYGDTLPSDEEVRALAGDVVLELVRSAVDSGWASAWQAHLTPVAAAGFTIRPPWLPGAPDDLVIDPGPSFGAASHPTTRMCLELLGELEPGGMLVDWGTGSGVLAIAAARLGFAPVVAVELDSGRRLRRAPQRRPQRRRRRPCRWAT